ncbi:MAG: VOC family protein [Planctomycetes bacterium]|nr:VOC family protein [Planctomycetota bacterium]
MSEHQTPPVGTFCWNELMTRDPDKAKAFYGELFGWDASVQSMGGAFDYYFFTKNGETVAGMFPMSGPMFEGVPDHWLSYVHVEDIDATAEEVKAQGGTIYHGPAKIPGMDSQFVVFADATGATGAAWSSK